MSYDIEVFFSPANELVTSLNVYLSDVLYGRSQLGASWMENTRSKLRTDFAYRREKEKRPVWDPVSLLIWQNPQLTASAQFLHWFETQSENRLIEALSPWVKKLPKNMLGMRDRTLSLLSEWHEQYFRHIERDIAIALANDTEAKRRTLPGQSTFDFIDKVTNGLRFEPKEGLAKIVLIPQYHCRTISLYQCFEGITICMYGVETAVNEMPEENLVSVEEALEHVIEDAQCMHIVRFLAEGNKPHSFTEVMKFSGLDKRTVFYLISKLRQAELIRIHIYTERRFAYSLRDNLPDKIVQLLQTAANDNAV